jgi:prephenate dehydrogenase
MTVQITIIGLGQTGTSLGLALAAHTDKVLRVGHDKEYGAEQLAKKKGAVDKTNHNLPSSVEEAGLVVLALPVHQVRETLDFIARDLKKDAVVVDLSPVKAGVAQWAQEILPQGVHYVGLVPSISPEFLWDTRTDRDAARADLFANSIFLLSAPRGTPGAALKLVSDFVSLLGATAMMTDFVESDGLMASAHVLPQLTSASLLNATIGQPGWQEARKAASCAYYSAASAYGEHGSVDALSMLSLHSRENSVRVLDNMITALIELRDDIADGNEESLKKRLETAKKGHLNWLAERGKGDWAELEKTPVEKISVMERLFGSKLGKPFKKEK